MQLDHYTSPFRKRQFPITVVCDHVTNAPNVGSLFRTADAFGIEKLIFCGDHVPLGRKMTKTSRATEKSVPYEIANDALEVVQQLKSQGYYLLALEVTSKSTTLADFNFPKHQSIALVVGDENFGVSSAILELCDAILHIPMFGQNSSMNVVQATSITLYEMTKQIQ